jgi:carbamate kinase
VCINYNTPQELALDRMTIAEARKHLADGQFAEGSMAPKIRAAIAFVEGTGKDAIITNAEKLGIDNGGTRIVIV